MATCCNDRLSPILLRLLDCLASSMEDCDAPPCRLFLSTAAEVPWDACCDCGEGVGQAWVSVASVSPLLTPVGGAAPVKCGSIFEADVRVGILRCALTMDDMGNAPDPMALTEEAVAIFRDRLIINQAIRCCFAQTIELDDWTLGDWDALGPQGGCVGGQVSMTIRFNDPKCLPSA